MRTTTSVIVLLLFGFFCLPLSGFSQDSSARKKIFSDSFNHIFSSYQLPFSSQSLRNLSLDSLAKKKLLAAVSLPDTNVLQHMLPSFSISPVRLSPKQFLQVGSGYISYSWNYRSGIDTPVVEKNISQHLVSVGFNATLAQSIPVRVTYFERRSNSSIFRDFRDIRVELNTSEFQRWRADKFRQYLNGMKDRFHDPLTKPVMDASSKKIGQLNDWLNYPAVRKKFIDAKEILISPQLLDTAVLAKKDSMLREAKEFVALYEKMQEQKEKYGKLYDSLRQEYTNGQKKIKRFQQLMNGNLNNPETIQELKDMAEKQGIKDSRFNKLSSAASSIRTLAIGKTNPNFSNLTLKNINVNGFNFEYNRNRIYFALVAGTVDFRVRDFVYNNQRRIPQYVYAVRTGYGVKEFNHIIFTYYEGKKQLYNGVTVRQSQYVKGVSVATQLVMAKNHRINAEFAQSASPTLYNQGAPNKKQALNFRDKNSQAYSLQIRSNIQATKTRLEGLYQHSGVNFQNFSNYRVNASANSWYLKAEQYFWNRNIQVVASLRKNDFSNPLVLQRYNANTVFKNFTATFRKHNWPVLSAGYMPSSQYTVIDSMVYENRYQVMQASVSHRYKIGTAEGYSVLMYNRFYNDASDTGFIYYNANNFFFSQLIRFSLHTANINISHTDNGQYTLDVWDAGIALKLLKQNIIGFGVKINHIATELPKVGFYGNARVSIPGIGELNAWLEKNYLPGLGQQLIRNDFYTIGFTRYFNEKK